MKKQTYFSALAATIFLAAGCCSSNKTVGQRTDALEDAAWESSCWISAADAPVVTGKVKDGSRAADGASWFVSTMVNEGKVVAAKWMTTGLGVYDIFLNGKLIGEEVLKPGFTHYEKTKVSFTYDVTDAFNKAAGAENVLSAQVTPGWWADKIITPREHEGMIGRKCAFRGVLELTYADGRKQLFGTDTEHWKAGIAGPVLHAAIFDGEQYDGREKPGAETPEKLSTPELNDEFAGQIVPSAGAEVYFREDLALSPVKAYIWEGIEGQSEDAYGKVIVKKEFHPGSAMTVHPGETLVIDFGQNCAAVPDFLFSAAEGTQLTCLPAELLNDGLGSRSRGMDGPEGSVHRLNLRIPQEGMILDYTFGSGRKHAFRPRSTFFGYRYLSITATGNVRIAAIRSIPVTSIAKNMETGRLVTGNDEINKLISNTYWGQLSNYLSVPTDCPQRDERLGWTADTQVFTETGTFFAATDRFFHKWMQDMRDSQGESGGYPGVAPTAQYGDEMMRLGWADAGIIVPWTVWKQFGDTSIIEENWESMERYMAHIEETSYDHTALIRENRNSQWADWLSYEPLETCTGRHLQDGKILPEAIEYWNYLSACYWILDAGMMRDMAEATSRDTSKYAAMTNEVKAFVKDKYLTSEGLFKTGMFNTMQTPAIFALKTGLVEGTAREDMISRLRDNFNEHGNCLQTGFLGTSILMPVLTENGLADVAYEVLFQHSNPSWLYSIDNGATTIWERWNSYMIDEGMGPKGMNSFNHYAYGCVCQWLWESVAGIAADPAEPGFRHIIMKPLPDRRLGSIDASFASASGLIKSAWKYDGDTWHWTFTIPEGATATVTLPGEDKATTYSAGTYSVSKTLDS